MRSVRVASNKLCCGIIFFPSGVTIFRSLFPTVSLHIVVSISFNSRPVDVCTLLGAHCPVQTTATHSVNGVFVISAKESPTEMIVWFQFGNAQCCFEVAVYIFFLGRFVVSFECKPPTATHTKCVFPAAAAVVVWLRSEHYRHGYIE